MRRNGTNLLSPKGVKEEMVGEIWEEAVQGKQKVEFIQILKTSKKKISLFQWKNDPKTYLEWEEKIDLTFYYHN